MVKVLCLNLLLVATTTWANPRRSVTGTDIYFVVNANNLHGDETGHDKEVDPFVKAFHGKDSDLPINGTGDADSVPLEKIGVSETLNNDNNPTWNTVFRTRYYKESGQVVHLIVRDHDPFNPDDPLAHAYIRLDDLVTKSSITANLEDAVSGSITANITSPIYLDLAVNKVPPLDNFGLSDPYINCYFRYGGLGKNYLFNKTGSTGNAETFRWSHVPFEQYQKGTSQIIRFEVFDEDTFTRDDALGKGELVVDFFLGLKRDTNIRLNGGASLTVSVARN